MPRPLPTPSACRIARAAVAAVAAGLALTGCSVTVDGIASAAPVPQPAPRPAATSSPATTPIPVPAPGTNTGVYAEWIADGWIPRPLLPVTEPDSGVTAWMFGTAEQQPGAPDGGTSYRSVDAPASVVTWFAVFPVPEGYVADAEQGAVNTAIARDGRVVSSEPVTVQGHRGLDVRIEFTTTQGLPAVDLIRYVELPDHLVGIESMGASGDDRVLQQVHQIMVDRFTVPST